MHMKMLISRLTHEDVRNGVMGQWKLPGLLMNVWLWEPQLYSEARSSMVSQ